MRIVSSSVTLAATAAAERSDKRSERLLAWAGDRPQEKKAQQTPREAVRVTVEIQAQPVKAPPAKTPDGVADDATDLTGDRNSLDALLVARMLDPDHGRMFARMLRGIADIQGAHNAPPPPAVGNADAAAPAGGAPARAGWGVEYDLHEEHREVETASFHAAGAVTTADGRTVTVDVALEMSREEVQRRDVSVRLGDAKKVDPLVLNLDGGHARFEGTQDFDLDADGKSERIARLGGGSAYLTMDRNGNGRVDDGSELFGPQSGDGFADLAALDDDRNGWIDEADAAFQKLALWSPAGGDGPPTSLARVGVGAIYLGSAATPFTVKADGTTAGTVARTGVYLREDGTAGTVQHVDLVA